MILKKIILIFTITLGVCSCSDNAIEKKGFSINEVADEDINQEYKKGILKDSLRFETRPRNVLLTINTSTATITGEIDTMATGGTTAGIDYTTVSN